MIQVRLASNLFLVALVFTVSPGQAAYGQSLPKCVQSCISSSAIDAKCSENNFACMCKVPLFSFTVQNCSRLYCSPRDQVAVEEGIDQLCRIGKSNNTFDSLSSSSLQIFTFSGTFTRSDAAPSTTGRNTGAPSPTLTSVSTPNTSAPGSGRSGGATSDSENIAHSQPSKAENRALSNHWDGVILLVWISVMALLFNMF